MRILSLLSTLASKVLSSSGKSSCTTTLSSHRRSVGKVTFSWKFVFSAVAHSEVKMAPIASRSFINKSEIHFIQPHNSQSQTLSTARCVVWGKHLNRASFAKNGIPLSAHFSSKPSTSVSLLDALSSWTPCTYIRYRYISQANPQSYRIYVYTVFNAVRFKSVPNNATQIVTWVFTSKFTKVEKHFL